MKHSSKVLRALVMVVPMVALSGYLACAPKEEHGPLAPSGTPLDGFNLEAFHPFGDPDTADAGDGDGDAHGDALAESETLASGDGSDDSDGPADGSTGDSSSEGDADLADGALEADAASETEASARIELTYPCDPPLTTSTAAVCGVTVQSWKIEDADDAGFVFHVGFDTDVAYCTNPPSSGPHYPIWAAFKSYTAPVPHENLVHDLEHGAVVVLFRCTSADGCPAIAASLQAVIDARPIDPECDPAVKRRIVLAPDPTLDVAVGAGAWGWTYRATCVDDTTLGAFIDLHYGHGTEDFCTDGCPGPFPTCSP